MNGTRFDLNIDAELAAVAVEYSHVAETGAEMIVEEVKSSIEDSDFPAAAGMPPHSPGPYRESWHATPARRRKDAIVAHAYSLASTDKGEALADVLEDGRGPIHPHPHWRAAVERAQRRLEHFVDRLNASLRGGL